MIYFMANEEVLTDETASVEHVATVQIVCPDVSNNVQKKKL